jgi:ABC-2 type transport system ATP-binding protein
VTAPGGDPAVVVRDLVKSYDDRDVVAGLTLDVHPGEILGLLGPNGAGKTTTIEILEGYRRPDGGSVRVLGLDPVRDTRALRPRMGIMLQQGGLPPQVRAREIVRLYASFFRDPEDADALLDRVGLADAARRRVKVLSGGERQRLALALALVGRPEVAMLDEPTAGMDPQAKAATREIVADLRDRGAAVVLTTHELPDLERLADRIAIVRRGRLVALGTPADIVAGVRRRLRFRVAGVLSAAGRGELAGALAVAAGGAATQIAGEGAAAGAGGPGPGTASPAPGTVSPAPRTAARPTVEEDGPGGAYRLDGLEPSPRVVAALADWCRGRDLLLTEMRAAGGTLEERFLELVADDTGDVGGPGDPGVNSADAVDGPDPHARAHSGGRGVA